VSFHSSPIVVDGQLLIGALYELGGKGTGLLFSVDASHGREAGAKRWMFTRGGQWMPIFATPIVAGGRVLFGEGYHENRECSLGCLDPRSPAQPLWTFKTASHVESTPTVKAGRIYFGSGDDGLYCLDLPVANEPVGKPSIRWHRELFHIDSSPLVAEGKVIVGTVIGDVYFSKQVLGIDAETGQVAWRYATQHAVPGSPSYSEGRVYVGIGNGKMTADDAQPAGSVLCLTAAKGDFVWEYKTPNSVLESPVVAGERIVFTCRDGHVYCVTAADGKLVWKHPLGDPIAAAAVVTGGRIYAMTVGGHLFCLTLADGEEVWKLDVPSPDDDAIANPCLVGGRLYVAAGGKVHCIGEATP
jgi:outer membrane protein assembly factor BamB